jgi:hypothetical protein
MPTDGFSGFLAAPLTSQRAGPLYLRLRAYCCMAANGREVPTPHIARPLVDHLVGGDQELTRHGESEGLCAADANEKRPRRKVSFAAWSVLHERRELVEIL